MAFGPPKAMKNGSCSATTVAGSAALPFVISTGAQRSGEICGVSGPSLGNVFRQSAAQERSAPSLVLPMSPSRSICSVQVKLGMEQARPVVVTDGSNFVQAGNNSTGFAAGSEIWLVPSDCSMISAATSSPRVFAITSRK
jgi:hypothetical protein